MILHTRFLMHLYLIYFFVLLIARNHKIQIRENPKLAKSKKKTEDETKVDEEYIGDFAFTPRTVSCFG